MVNNKACKSASVYVPGQPIDRLFLCSHNSKTCWPILVIQTLLENSWDALGPCFVKKFGDDWEGWWPPRIVYGFFFMLTLLDNALIDSGHSKTVGKFSGRTGCKLCINCGDACMGVMSPPKFAKKRYILEPLHFELWWMVIFSSLHLIEAILWALGLISPKYILFKIVLQSCSLNGFAEYTCQYN